ncbi:sensor histidine kinase [Mesorhizobium xinjiangense]|uniref:sensor histidine kinase n=1 Tax=Mesorhizobium xinjiangense TaxID=2678685 RepID=UPI0012EE794C|nr:PAS domain-containing sensor histidine kinase [Mesorhizobium xinjiangense]
MNPRRKTARKVPEITGGLGRGLMRALRNADISVLYQDADLHVVWAENFPESWSAQSRAGSGDHDFLPQPEADRVCEAKRAILEDGVARRLEIRVPDSVGARWFDIWIDADCGEDGRIEGVITTTVEITEQKHREQTLRALLREVSHRSKNLLAIIQSVAAQTGRDSEDIDDFLRRFRGRLHSLSASQDLVTLSNWRGARLKELVMGQVQRFCADPERNIRLDGANPYLNPNAALHVGLAMHELAVNSVSAGALSRDGGTVTIAATPSRKAGLQLVWNEHMRDGLRPFLDNQRFSSVALERIVPTALNGKARLTVSNGAIEYRLTIPDENFEAA